MMTPIEDRRVKTGRKKAGIYPASSFKCLKVLKLTLGFILLVLGSSVLDQGL